MPSVLSLDACAPRTLYLNQTLSRVYNLWLRVFDVLLLRLELNRLDTLGFWCFSSRV